MNIQAQPEGLESCVVACWSCKGPASPRALFCSVCNAVQPPRAADHFQRLGLLPGFEIDLAQLERHYFGLQRKLHPDRFAGRSGCEKLYSQQQATQLNEAYETLKDPMRRAVYLLKLAGRAVDADSKATVTDPALLMESMEAREALAEAETAAEAGAVLIRAEADIASGIADLAQAFAERRLDQAEKLVLRLKYLSRLAEEARAHKARLTRSAGE